MSETGTVAAPAHLEDTTKLQRSLRWLTYSMLAFALYCGMAGMGLEMALWQQYAPLIWPPAGFALLVVLRGGLSYLPVVFLGALTVKLFEGAGVLAGVLCASSYVLAAFVARDLLVRIFKIDFALERMQDVLLFVGFGVFATPLVSSFVTTATICEWQGEFCPNFGELFAVRWLSDALGVLVVTPMLLVWHAKTRVVWRNAQAFEVLLWLAALIFLGAMIFRNWAPTDTLRYPLELTMFPLMAWASIRFGQRGTSVGIFIVAMMAVWELRDVIGPEATRTITQPPGYLWVFVGVLSITGLLLASVLTEVRNREDQATANEKRLRAFITAMPDLAFVIDEDGRYVEVFAPRTSSFAESAPKLVGREIEDIYPAPLARDFMHVIRDVLLDQTLKVHRYAMSYQGEEHWFEGRVAPLDGEASEGPRAVIWVAYDVTANERAQRQLKERDRLLAATSRVEGILLEAKADRRVFHAVLASLGRSLELDVLQIWERVDIAEGKLGSLALAYEWAHTAGRQPSSESTPRLELGAATARWAQLLEAREAVWWEPSAIVPAFQTAVDEAPLHGLLLLPVMQTGRWWGVLALAPKAGDVPWSKETVRLLMTIAKGLSAFLDNQAYADALTLAKERADSANAAKSMFLAMMSHEIRTPMNAILGFTDILKQGEMAGDQREYLEIISRSGRDLLNNILDFSKLESNSLVLEAVPLNLETVIIESLETNLGKAREKGLLLDYELVDEVKGALLGDPHRLRQILLNLLSNAIKFTRVGHVQVRASLQHESAGHAQVRLAVEDTGIGIPAEKCESLFRPFTQADSSTTREYGGTGLGLSICRRLADQMDGRIWLESAPGHGTTFFVELRLKLAEEIVPDTTPEEDAQQLLPDFAESHPLRILVVEDDPINRRMAQTFLTRLGYVPQLAANGKEALAYVQAYPVDVILLDVQMAEMDGFELTRRLREEELTSDQPRCYIIALTAMALSHDRKRCQEVGMDGFIAKPYSPKVLKAALVEAAKTIA